MITKTLAERLRMMYIEMRSKNPGGVEGFDTPLFFEAIAQAEGEKAGELSDEDIERTAHDLSNGRHNDHYDGIVKGLRHARDHGYLRPSQAIGEPAKEAPYGIKELQLLPGYFWVTFRGKPVIQGRADQPCDSFPEGQALRIRTALNNAYAQSPISTEARDRAIEALEKVIDLWKDELINEGYDTSTNFDKATQALSALR
jgi:hypothetical protein